MNLGQFLTDKSPLPSGTVAEHLAAIYAQTGSGPGEHVFGSSFHVCADDRSVVVMRTGGQRDVFVGMPDRDEFASDDGSVSVLLPTPSIYCKTAIDEIWIVETQQKTVVQSAFEKSELKINH